MNPIDEKVFDGIRKTINRFREKPFHYFTEADIHSSLLNDMLEGGSGNLTRRPDGNEHISVSLVHQEYPTNFRYTKESMLHSVNPETAGVENQSGDRGNYDLAVINPDFLNNVLENNNLYESLRHLINKNNQLAIDRKRASLDKFQKELLYAIEVKFIHPFNARNKNMLYEVIRDENKLLLAYETSNGFVRPINLVFCSTAEMKRSDDNNTVVSLIRDYIEKQDVVDYDGNKYTKPGQVVTIFIESFIDPASASSTKTTVKPILSGGKGEWVEDLRVKLNLRG
jgi:hypothetical protein